METIKTIKDFPTTNQPYRELVGALLYLSTTCRPDISFATSYLTRFIDNTTDHHWDAANIALLYLKGTQNYGFIFRKEGCSLIGYRDSDFAGDLSDRKSTSGFVFIHGGSAVSRLSKKQSIVAKSVA